MLSGLDEDEQACVNHGFSSSVLRAEPPPSTFWMQRVMWVVHHATPRFSHALLHEEGIDRF